MRAHARETRASKSGEQREAKLEQARLHARETRASKSVEQREAMLEQARLHDRETRVSDGGEQREAETDCSTSCYLGPRTNCPGDCASNF